MPDRIPLADLEAYLDEALPSDEMARMEALLRNSPELIHQLAAINSRRDAGLHSVGEIWRRFRLSCPSREELGSLLLNVLGAERAEYILFHIEQVGCRLCAANLEDLKRLQAERDDSRDTRQRKYFQTSAGYLRKKE